MKTLKEITHTIEALNLNSENNTEWKQSASSATTDGENKQKKRKTSSSPSTNRIIQYR